MRFPAPARVRVSCQLLRLHFSCWWLHQESTVNWTRAYGSCSGAFSRSSGVTKQLVLDNLSDVLFILDEAGTFSCPVHRFLDSIWKALFWICRSATLQVTDNGVIMETDDEKISARIKMIDETEVTQSAQVQDSKYSRPLHEKTKAAVLLPTEMLYWSSWISIEWGYTYTSNPLVWNKGTPPCVFWVMRVLIL